MVSETNKQKSKAPIYIAMRLDTGPSIGLGHFIRCMSLAEELQKDKRISISLICRNKLPWIPACKVLYLDKEYRADAAAYQVPSIDDEIERLKPVLHQHQIDCLLVDHYGAGDSYFQKLRSSVACFVCIDDGLGRDIPVDLILNGNLYGTQARYGAIPRQLLGGEYTLLRSEFCSLPKRSINHQLNHLYITSGGADPLRFCESVVQVLCRHRLSFDIHVIIGVDFPKEYITSLEAYPVTLHRNANMRNCMLHADVFVTSAGSTLYELAAAGTPSISYILADNQAKVAEAIWNRNCSMRGGWFSDFQAQELTAALEELKAPAVRRALSQAGQKAVSTQGANHAAQKIKELLL